MPSARKVIKAIKVDQFRENSKEYVVLMTGNMIPRKIERAKVKTEINSGRLKVLNMKIASDGRLIDDVNANIDLTEEKLYYSVLSKNIQCGYSAFYTDILSKIREISLRKFEFGQNNSLESTYRKQAKEFGDRLIGMIKAYHTYMRPIKRKLITTKIVEYNTISAANMQSQSEHNYRSIELILNRDINRLSNAPAINNWRNNWKSDPSTYDCFVGLLSKIWNTPESPQYTVQQKQLEIGAAIDILNLYIQSLLPTYNYSIMHQLFLIDLNTGLVKFINGDNSALPIHPLTDDERKQKLDSVLKDIKGHYNTFRDNIARCSNDLNRCMDRYGDTFYELLMGVLPPPEYKEKDAHKKYIELIEFERTENIKLVKSIVKMLADEKDPQNLQDRLSDMSDLANQISTISTNPFLALIGSAPIARKYLKTMATKFNEKAMRVYNQYSNLSIGKQGVVEFVVEWQRVLRLSPNKRRTVTPKTNKYLTPLLLTLLPGSYLMSYTNTGSHYSDWNVQSSWLIAYCICCDSLNGSQSGHQLDAIYWKIFEDACKNKVTNVEDGLRRLKDALMIEPVIQLDLKQELQGDVVSYIDFNKAHINNQAS